VRLLEADLGLAGWALEGAPAIAHAARGFVLALGDPLQHAVLVGFEAAGARVDPGPVGLLGVGLEADEADVLRIAERCRHGNGKGQSAREGAQSGDEAWASASAMRWIGVDESRKEVCRDE